MQHTAHTVNALYNPLLLKINNKSVWMQALNKEHTVLVLSSFYIPLSVSFAPGNLKTCSLNASESRFYEPCSGVNTGCCLSKVTPSWGHSGNTVDLSVRTTPLVYPRTHCTNLTSWRHGVKPVAAIMSPCQRKPISGMKKADCRLSDSPTGPWFASVCVCACRPVCNSMLLPYRPAREAGSSHLDS